MQEQSWVAQLLVLAQVVGYHLDISHPQPLYHTEPTAEFSQRTNSQDMGVNTVLRTFPVGTVSSAWKWSFLTMPPYLEVI